MKFIADNFPMVMVAAISGALLLWSFARKMIFDFPEIDTFAAVKLINDQNAFILDVRENHEYAAGHIKNAHLVPSGKLSSRLDEIEKGRPIVVYCRSGARSSSACVILKKNGFDAVHNLKGGMLAWEAAKLPIEK